MVMKYIYGQFVVIHGHLCSIEVALKLKTRD